MVADIVIEGIAGIGTLHAVGQGCEAPAHLAYIETSAA
jgi:hypothetical protein